MRPIFLAAALFAVPANAASLVIAPYTGLYVEWAPFLDGRTEAVFKFEIATFIPDDSVRLVTLSDLQAADLTWSIRTRLKSTDYMGLTESWKADLSDLTSFSAMVENVNGSLRTRDIKFTSQAVASLSGSAGIGPTSIESFGEWYIFTDGRGKAGGFFTALPAPATWAMMIAGFGLVGLTLRQRRALPQPFARVQMRHTEPERG